MRYVVNSPILENKEQDMSEQEWNSWPMAGTECEARYVHATNSEWFAFKCLAAECGAYFGWAGKEPEVLFHTDFEFRPIRTAAQRAEDALLPEIRGANNGSLFDDEPRMLAEHIICMIRDGRIPGVKLEDEA